MQAIIMDATLSKLRLSPLALKCLEESGIEDFGALVRSDGALQLLRKHLNPIQQSKLNALVKEFESCQDERECDHGDKVLIDSERNATRQEIISQLDLERQCLEEINNLILAEPAAVKEGAKQILQKSKAAHQSRASRLNAILRTKPTDGICGGADPTEEQLPRAMRRTNLSVRFQKLNKPKRAGPKNAIYNSPRAREGVHNSIFSSASVLGAFAVAKDVFTDFISGVTSSGKQPRDEPMVEQALKLTRKAAVAEPTIQPPQGHHPTSGDLRPAKRALLEPLANDPPPNTSTNTSTSTSTSTSTNINTNTNTGTSIAHSYHTHTTVQLDEKPGVQLPSPQTFNLSPLQATPTDETFAAATPTESCLSQPESEPAHVSGNEAMDDSDYVSVSTFNQLHQQHITLEWRESLLLRLSTLCYQFAQCNYDCELLHLSRHTWLRAGDALEFGVLRPFTLKKPYEVWREHRQHEMAGMDLTMKEGQNWDTAYAAGNRLLEWNREAVRLNLSLIENPHVDQTLWLQAVGLHTDQNRYLTVMMQHSHQVLVQRGVYRLPSLDELRAVHAQYTSC